MSLEQNIERIATALEKLVELAANPKVTVAASETAAPATTRTRSKKAETPTPEPKQEEVKQEEVKQEEVKQEQKANDDDGWDFDGESCDAPDKSADQYPDSAAKEKAQELACKGFGEVKEFFYEVLNKVRDSFGSDTEKGKEAARQLGYPLLEKHAGGKAFNETTLPKEKFFDFVYDTEVARAGFFKSK